MASVYLMHEGKITPKEVKLDKMTTDQFSEEYPEYTI